MLNNRKYVHKALDRVNKSVDELEVNIETEKIIIFSDHHRGGRDKADDFLNNEPIYLKALDYYQNRGFRLILLGDVEEFWENPFNIVIKSYREVLQKEQAFSSGSGLIKIWGNHDEVWRAKVFFNKYLGDIFPGMQARESVKLKFHNGHSATGNILLVHGHQGTAASERFAGFSRFFVRHGWRHIQKWFSIPLSTPATNIRLRSKLDMDMFTWASAKSGLVLICGHTHQPVFMSFTHADFLEAKIERLEAQITAAKANSITDIDILEKEKAATIAELKRIEINYGSTHLQVDRKRRKPCYFNTGCCSFSNGDITGIEIDQGKIRLIKWSPREKNSRVVLEANDLRKIFEACQ